MHYDVAFGYGIDTIDGRQSQCPVSSTSEDPPVSISELPRCPTIPAPLQAPTSILVDYLNGAQNSAQIALPLGYVAAENEESCMAFPLVSHGWGYWGTQDHASDHVVNDDATLSSPSMADLLRLYATGSSTYLQENEVISTFGDLNHGCAGPAMGPSTCSHTSGQVIDSTAPSSGLSSPPLSLVQELRLSDGLSSDYFALPPEQIRTDMPPPAPLLCMQTIIQHPFLIRLQSCLGSTQPLTIASRSDPPF
ncbi:hypothetical protein EDC04DRAFT_2625307 [Pisolithus marmoratus]|nr:hypothetical protein EDC04DRAFT_2625307 [Pisolithus marmoratus]